VWDLTKHINSLNKKTPDTKPPEEPTQCKRCGGGVEKKSAKQICHNADALRLSHLLYERMKQNYYGTKEPNFNTWAIEVEKMINIDKRPIEEIEYIINWSQSDKFWASNILSTSKLRKKFEQLAVAIQKSK